MSSIREEGNPIVKRASPRLGIPVYARLNNTGPYIERRGNISIGGFCFEGHDCDPGKPVELLFELPELGFWIHVNGIILGTNNRYMWPSVRGRFSNINAWDKNLINGWITHVTEMNELERLQ